jgi:hypothetical protein
MEREASCTWALLSGGLSAGIVTDVVLVASVDTDYAIPELIASGI